MSAIRIAQATSLVLFLAPTAAFAGNPAVTVTIDATASRHAINPNIYGVAFASKADLKALNAPLHRMGGNSMTDYNWSVNAQNLAQDWYFESYPEQSATPGEEADTFISQSKQAGAAPMLTVPLAGWVAKLGNKRSILPSFSVAKYGAQCGVDPYDDDAGNGLMPDCSTPITGNDPTDAYVRDTTAHEQKWIKHLVKTWGRSSKGGVGYYLMDNEPSIWFSTHRDIHPVGPHADEYRDKVVAESAAIKSLDPKAKIVAPEEWGWEAYFYSGYDQQYAAEHGYCCWPDHDGMQGGMDYIPWLLSQWKNAGHPVDVLSVHFYPQGGEDGNDVSTATQLLRKPLDPPALGSELHLGELDRRAGLSDPAAQGLDRGQLLRRHARRDHRIQLGRREPHQRRHDAGRHLRHLRPAGPRHGDALDRAGRHDADLQGDADVSQL